MAVLKPERQINPPTGRPYHLEQLEQQARETPERILARERLRALMQEIHALYVYLDEEPKTVVICGECKKRRLARAA